MAVCIHMYQKVPYSWKSSREKNCGFQRVLSILKNKILKIQLEDNNYDEGACTKIYSQNIGKA